MPSAMMIETIFDIEDIKNNVKVDSKAALQSVKASYSIKLRYLAKTQRLSIARLNEILFGENSINAKVEYITTTENIADFFTKALDHGAFMKHREAIGMKVFNKE